MNLNKVWIRFIGHFHSELSKVTGIEKNVGMYYVLGM